MLGHPLGLNPLTLFDQKGLQVTIEANQKVVNFCYVTFDLNTGLYEPFMNDSDQPLYVNSKSNYPPSSWKTSHYVSIED